MSAQGELSNNEQTTESQKIEENSGIEEVLVSNYTKNMTKQRGITYINAKNINLYMNNFFDKAQYNALTEEEKEIMDVLLQDDTELPSNLEEEEILDIAKLRFQALCHQSGRFDMKCDTGIVDLKYIKFSKILIALAM